jgi:hypothetical protein
VAAGGVVVTPRDDLRDRIALEMCELHERDGNGACPECREHARRVMAAIPGLVDASNAREGWLHSTADGDVVRFGPHPGLNQMLPRVLVISADGVSRETGS